MNTVELRLATDSLGKHHKHDCASLGFCLTWGRVARVKSWRLMSDSGEQIVIALEEAGPDKPAVPVAFPLREVSTIFAWPNGVE